MPKPVVFYSYSDHKDIVYIWFQDSPTHAFAYMDAKLWDTMRAHLEDMEAAIHEYEERELKPAEYLLAFDSCCTHIIECAAEQAQRPPKYAYKSGLQQAAEYARRSIEVGNNSVTAKEMAETILGCCHGWAKGGWGHQKPIAEMVRYNLSQIADGRDLV